MERLLVLKLQADGCEAEAWLNGVAIVRAGALCPVAVVPVHEYMIAGENRLELVVGPNPAAAPGVPPPPTPRVADGTVGASLRILLPRIGGVADEGSARTLAQQVWAPAEGTPYETPLSLQQDVAMNVSFQRWRWLDAPEAEPSPALTLLALAYVQRLALDLARGAVDNFIAATRLRSEELALAYQRKPDAEAARLRAALLQLHADKALNFVPLKAESFVLRPLAGGRLFDCLHNSGQPALRTVPGEDGASANFPLRLAVVEGKLYVLR
jgi:hypothetical protein